MAIQDNQDHDSPWKEALELYFKEAIALLCADIHRAIDWTQPIVFLDKELQKILAKAERGRTYADKLVKVKLTNGEEKWLLIHIEVQGEPEDGFAKRMFDYNSRICQRYKKDVISLAILTDTRKDYRENRYQFAMFGCEITFTYPIIKLLDFLPQRQALLNDDNVFGLIILAQIDAKLLKDPMQRLVAKVTLIRQLYERGYDKQQILILFNLIDWMITLPKELVIEFEQNVDEIEQEKDMQYINSLEQLYLERGIQKGMQEGMQEGMQQAKLEAAHTMIKDFGLSVKDVALKLKVPLDDLVAYINKQDTKS